MSVYQPGIPTGTVDLDQDYLNIQNNFGQLDTTFGVGHTKFSDVTGQNGYHKAIQIIPQAAPTAISGYGQLFSSTVNDGINVDQALFWLSGGNKNIPLTRNFTPTNAQNGATMLPGGLILNWGLYNAFGGNFSSGQSRSGSGGNTVITLTQSFPNNLYLSGGSLLYTEGNLPSGGGSFACRSSQLSSGAITTLSWLVSCGTNNYTGFVWWALGN
jgi:hypothetical protein